MKQKRLPAEVPCNGGRGNPLPRQLILANKRPNVRYGLSPLEFSGIP